MVIYVAKDEWVEKVIKKEVYCLQNQVVEFLLKHDESLIDEIKNLYYTPEPLDEGCYDILEPEPHEIFQWFSISPWLAKRLDEIKYPVLVSDEFGCWMGRITYGQALEADGVWSELYDFINKEVI